MHPANTALKAHVQKETEDYSETLKKSIEGLSSYLQRHTNSLIQRDFERLKADTISDLKSATNMRDRQLRDFKGKDMDDLIEHTYQVGLKRIQQDVVNFRIKHHIPDNA